jgi:hypothetical protein
VELCSARAADRVLLLTNSERRTETQRNVNQKGWNRHWIGAPTRITSKQGDEQRRNPFETIGLRAGPSRQPTGTEISGRTEFGSPNRSRTEDLAVNSRHSTGILSKNFVSTKMSSILHDAGRRLTNIKRKGQPNRITADASSAPAKLDAGHMHGGLGLGLPRFQA